MIDEYKRFAVMNISVLTGGLTHTLKRKHNLNIEVNYEHVMNDLFVAMKCSYQPANKIVDSFMIELQDKYRVTDEMVKDIHHTLYIVMSSLIDQINRLCIEPVFVGDERFAISLNYRSVFMIDDETMMLELMDEVWIDGFEAYHYNYLYSA